MLSHTCKAAVKAVVFLGLNSENGAKSGIIEVARSIRENEHTVGKLLQKLAKAGIINSAKGPNGGFFLTPEQQQQRIIRIVELIDGPEVFSQCGMGLSQCNESKPCPFHNEYKPIREQFEKMYTENRICDLYDDVNKGVAFLTG